MPASSILTVTALTQGIKHLLEANFPYVWVRGQVVNLSRPSSGHLYFSLRDEENSLGAVWFKNNQRATERFDPLTGEVFEGGPHLSLATTLENGQEIICAGRLQVYGSRGVYQLVVEIAQDAGIGNLHVKFERLKQKLAGLGYFATERKRPLPYNPLRVAVITAPQGAALQDFLRIAKDRGFGVAIRIYPSIMQGDTAPGKIITLLQYIAKESWAELVVIIRGGGSLEDLWAFNDEGLAKVIFDYPLPVVAGIGHEVDFTLADLTADVRAATPTHVAHLLWPDRKDLKAQLAALQNTLRMAENRYLQERSTKLQHFIRTLFLRSPTQLLENQQERLRHASRLMQSTLTRILERREDAMEHAIMALGHTTHRMREHEASLKILENRLKIIRGQLFVKIGHDLERSSLRLEALSPKAPLERGYALIRNAKGTFVNSIDMITTDELLQVMLHDGDFSVRVQEIENKP